MICQQQKKQRTLSLFVFFPRRFGSDFCCFYLNTVTCDTNSSPHSADRAVMPTPGATASAARPWPTPAVSPSPCPKQDAALTWDTTARFCLFRIVFRTRLFSLGGSLRGRVAGVRLFLLPSCPFWAGAPGCLSAVGGHVGGFRGGAVAKAAFGGAERVRAPPGDPRWALLGVHSEVRGQRRVACVSPT